MPLSTATWFITPLPRSQYLGMALQNVLRQYTNAAASIVSDLLSFTTKFAIQVGSREHSVDFAGHFGWLPSIRMAQCLRHCTCHRVHRMPALHCPSCHPLHARCTLLLPMPPALVMHTSVVI